jgi:hypothetical protein
MTLLFLWKKGPTAKRGGMGEFVPCIFGQRLSVKPA